MSIPYLVLLTSSYIVAAGPTEIDRNWHQWRGPTATGVSTTADPPILWDQETNIQWKVSIPGDGSGTPIVWNDRVYVVSAVQTDRQGKAHRAAADAKTVPPANYYQFLVTCLARQTGETIWQEVLVEAIPHEGRHQSHSYAAASPVTDGEHLYVSFGSRGIFGMTLDGAVLWERGDLGDLRTRYGWGEAITPALYRDSLVVNWDHEDDSFIAALDTKTGEPRWKIPRDEPSSWSTPLIVEHRGRVQVVVNATNRVRSYDITNGDLIWQCGGQTINAIPSPVTADGIVYCVSGYRGQAAYAISLDSTGDLTGKEAVWKYQRGTPYVPSPLVYRDRLYFSQGLSAILTCLDCGTGKPVLREQRLPAVQSLYASPVAAAGRIYIVDRDGTTVVLRDSPELEVLAVNHLNDPIDASPALVGGQMFLRSRGALYCIEQE